MKIPIYQVDAFTDSLFGGNPAAVCILESWPADELLQKIAAENNLAETAYIVTTENGYDLRWFTPAVEIDLCGHATLAAAYIIFRFIEPALQTVSFSTKSGTLTVNREAEDRLSLDFPARKPTPAEITDAAIKAMGKAPAEAWQSRDLMLVYENEADILALEPDMLAFKELNSHFAVIATAKGDEADFVSRFFAPLAGIPEDPVTGSAHCTLIPFWAERLEKDTLLARQLSARGGTLYCQHQGERVTMSGKAVLFMQGEIYL
ncbi:PhzF family phenazine biosynthesis protein [Aliamphritea spongicola]|uniref:PhzF family phenazine biosynthesis protein n=1 Tax=Aliamphritea spongicola TaxID=707589 RepID=UPI00196B9EDE|nr:PhzF family phenazine biosynthesis protein [Aliamphritea spongicola]MBN3561028.1 PhzF family phenazine biosynthesis protein [Aliamphritea spongicola]